MTIAEKRKEYRIINILFKTIYKKSLLSGEGITFEKNTFSIT